MLTTIKEILSKHFIIPWILTLRKRCRCAVVAILRLHALSESANLNVLVEHAQKVTTHRWIQFPTQPF
jgi:hypothetical protein